MGLDIIIESREGKEIDSFRAGSYSGFGDFRRTLAKTLGIELNEMVGFGGSIEWKQNTPFIELLNHSDCEGKIGVIGCKSLLRDFEDYFEKNFDKRELIIMKLENGEETEWFLECMKMWNNKLKLVVENGGRLIFC